MNKKQANYWFNIETYVYISVKKDWVMLYNTITGEILEYREKPEILKLILRLRAPKNLMVIPITEDELKNPGISEFIETVRSKFMGDIIETTASKRKPIQLSPIPKIQKDVKYLEKIESRSVGEEMMTYLKDVTLYLNEECAQNCEICKDAYKQFPCCTTRAKSKNELELEIIKELFEQMKGSGVVNVNILGGDIFAYTRINKLLEHLKAMRYQTCIYLHYLNAELHETRLNELATETTTLKILVTNPIQKETLARVIETTRRIGMKTEVIFIITDESEIEEAETSTLQPYYNGNNRKMYEENIYINREDLEEANPTLKEIVARQKVNPSNFGRLIIKPDGRIYANINAKPLGVLGKNTIYEIVYREMTNGKSWRKARKNVQPCKRCVFNNLCPPLSDMNTALKKNNFCHIF